MFIDAEKFIAWKFMLKGSEKGKFSPLTLFAWLALGVGVWAMGCLLSVMYGFEGALKDRFLRAYPHIRVAPKMGVLPIKGYESITQSIEEVPGVLKVAPYLESELILQSDYRGLGVVVVGLEAAELEEKKALVKSGVIPSLESKQPQVLMGMELARRVGARLGSQIELISPIETTGASGMVPLSLRYEVSGLFQSGHYDFDEQYVYLTIEDARDLMKAPNSVTGWQVWGSDYDSADGLRDQINQILPDHLEAQSWTQFNSALFRSLKLEQLAMFLIFSFAILIAVMNISITLMMYVVYKRKNIGILRAMGATKAQIRKIFLWQGGWIGVVGLGVGAMGTTLTLLYIKLILPLHYQLPDIYYDRSIPIEIRPMSFVLIYCFAAALIFLATIYPARKAMQTHPIEAIRS